ncbi:unnamed protein product [Pleuronectes platessa]|uniref:Uncharacterized protein n=1 Tax=Pleuronectes platessa TaxID=8262 RepID=A0A9N7UPM7_PLEPL|nr:unnamed protein product [Pleuronectes platessa]
MRVVKGLGFRDWDGDRERKWKRIHVPVTQEEKNQVLENELVHGWMRVTSGVTTAQAALAAGSECLVDVSSHNGLLCESGRWGGELDGEEKGVELGTRNSHLKGSLGWVPICPRGSDISIQTTHHGFCLPTTKTYSLISGFQGLWDSGDLCSHKAESPCCVY